MCFRDCFMVQSFHCYLLTWSFDHGFHRKAFPCLSVWAGCRTVCSAVWLRVGIFRWTLVPLFINLKGHRTLPSISLMVLEWGEYLPLGHHSIDYVAAPGLQRVPVGSALRIAKKVPRLCRYTGGTQEPMLLSLPLFLSISSAQFFVTCFLTGLLIYPTIGLL